MLDVSYMKSVLNENSPDGFYAFIDVYDNDDPKTVVIGYEYKPENSILTRRVSHILSWIQIETMSDCSFIELVKDLSLKINVEIMHANQNKCH